MVDYLKGRWPSRKPLPKEIKEFMIVLNTGWSLEYVRAMSLRDYEIFNILSMIYDSLKSKKNGDKT